MAEDLQRSQFSEEWLAQERGLIQAFFESKVPQVLQSQRLEESSQCTAEICDSFAQKTLKTLDIRPVESQGAASYTLVCLSQNLIIQFRLHPLNERVLELAHNIYDELAPIPNFISGFLLPVYIVPVLPGVVHFLQPFPKENFPILRQLTTVRDLALFVAKAAFWPQSRDTLSTTSWTSTAEEKLKDLARMENLHRLEPRFAQKAIDLSSQLYLLDKLPLVLTHVDFAEVNLMVEPSTGHLTGVLDFDGARTEAFGMCLFGVYEGFFGEMRDSQWKFFEQPVLGNASDPNEDGRLKSVRETLQTAFWDALWEAVPLWMKKEDFEQPVTVALDLGIINRYFDRPGDINPEDENDIRSVNWATALLLDRPVT